MAKRNGVKYSLNPRREGQADTDEVQITGSGIKTALVSIPLMYMHTPVEVADPRDIEETARLIALASTI